MKKYQIMYYVGAAISLLVGLWHFTVPWMFGWASYIPYETLVVPINYVNLCFSFLLSGLSLTVILWGKKVFAGNSEAFCLYGFLLALLRQHLGKINTIKHRQHKKGKQGIRECFFHWIFHHTTPKMNLVLAITFSILPCGGHPDKRYKQQNTYENRTAELPIRHPHI